MKRKLITIVVPVYNEAPNIVALLEAIKQTTTQLPYRFELVFIDDGSSDDSVAVLKEMKAHYKNMHIIEFARNFGKEAAVSAGLHHSRGEAVIVIDADLQMPPALMGEFLQRWEKGAEVVVGIFAKRSMSPLKALGAKCFYKIMQIIGNTKITPNATDYRLLDRKVVNAFNQMTERNRMTRGIIDWMGFQREYVKFRQAPRHAGEAQYGYRKLFGLAFNSLTAYSLVPLKLAGYIGTILMILTTPLGIFMFIERYVLGDPLRLGIESIDMLTVLMVFAIGMVLSCLGLVALYIGRIHAEVANRPLYIVRDSLQAEELEGEG